MTNIMIEDYFTDEFRKFYIGLSEFAKRLVIIISLRNNECPENYYNIIFDNWKENEKSMIKDNYNYRTTDERLELKYFDDKEKEYLKNRLETLDGTLLCDIVSKSLTNHKIFHIFLSQ